MAAGLPLTAPVTQLPYSGFASQGEGKFLPFGLCSSSDEAKPPDIAGNERQTQCGFSTTELLISVIIMVVMIAAAIVRIQPVIQEWRANRAMYVISGQLRWARQTSIADRRDIQVQFLGTNEIKLIRQDQPAGQTVISDLYLTNSVQYMLVGGMTDTPDAFGNASAIEFAGVADGPPIMQFQSDGTFVDGNGNPINGTVFLGIAQFPSTARAVTVLGATGRVRGFGSAGGAWIQ